MTSPDRTVVQAARDRLPAVAGPRAGRTPSVPDRSAGRARHRSTSPGGEALVQPVIQVPFTGSPIAGDRVPWLPMRPVDPGMDPGGAADPPRAADGTVRPDDDVADVALRTRTEALAAAAAGYARTHGSPVEREPGDVAPSPRRWGLSTRHAVVAAVALLVLASGVVVRAWTAIPGPPDAMVASVPGEGGTVPPAEGPGGPAAGAGGPGSTGHSAAGGAAGTGTAGAVSPVGGTSVLPGGPGGPGGAGAPGGPGAAGAPSPGGAAGTHPGAPAGAPVVVHVVGHVPAPGVLTLAAGSRVADAVAAAGGPGAGADLSAVNLARPLVDGEQIRVPAHGEPVAPVAGPATAGGAAGAASAGPVALNTADLAALDALPGIGPVLAQRILDWRSEHGGFRTVEDLGEVTGIGEALLSRLRPLVRV